MVLRTAIPFSFICEIFNAVFEEYVKTQIVSVFKIMEYQVRGSLITHLENFYSCSDVSTFLLSSLNLLRFFLSQMHRKGPSQGLMTDGKSAS